MDGNPNSVVPLKEVSEWVEIRRAGPRFGYVVQLFARFGWVEMESGVEVTFTLRGARRTARRLAASCQASSTVRVAELLSEHPEPGPLSRWLAFRR